jgi:hypothetical protein
VVGGQLPASSDDTAYQRIGCTNLAGLDRRNFEADVAIPGLGVAEGVTSRVWTSKRGDTVSSYSTHEIAKLTLGDSAAGTLTLRGIESRSRAFNRSGRFGTESQNSIARIVFQPAVGPAQDLDIPAPNRPLVIPGLARIEVGQGVRRVTPSSARVATNVVDITLLPAGTRVRVAQTQAQIGGGVRRGLFVGYSAALEARALADNARVGRTPLLLMPCQGTKGKEQFKDTARVNLDNQVIAKGLLTGQVATNGREAARGTEAAQVADVSLGAGRIVITAVRGVVNVERTRAGVLSNIKGTSVGRIVIDGKTYSLPRSGALEIPGLVRIQDAVRTKLKNGLKVVGLRVTLLDGSGAVVDLGIAQLGIRRGAPIR